MDEQTKELIKRFPMLLNATAWPKKYSCSFIEPGLVSYENEGLGKCYIDKPALDKLAPTFIGKPIVDRNDHVDGMKPQDLDRVAKGYITDVYWKDNWYWADFLVFDDKIKDDLENKKYSVSCAYEVTAADDKGGIRNNINFDQEVLNGVGTHIAIVPNPRYNGAIVLFNSSGGKTGMKIKGWFKKLLGTGVKNELSPDDMINVDDKKVPVKDLMSAVEDEQADEAKKNEEPKEQELSPDSVIKIGGKDVTLENAINIYKKRNSKKNAEELEIETKKKQEEEDKKNAEEADKKKKDEEMKNAAEAEEKKKKDEEDKKNADEKAAKEKKEADKKNAEDEEEKKKKEIESKKNSAHFLSIKNAAEQRTSLNGPKVQVIEDKRARGVELFGPKA